MAIIMEDELSSQPSSSYQQRAFIAAARPSAHHQQQQATSSPVSHLSLPTDQPASATFFTASGPMEHLNLVKKMIAQSCIEISIVLVIAIYLIYYFSQISKKPKLIGNSRSKFVQFIKSNLSNTLASRFSPLIYFWGTNPQTALFGYLQGNLSLHEMPREKFKRQYLYVSDVQYLVSNVDLTEHYRKDQSKPRGLVLAPLQVQQLQATDTPNNSNQLNENIRLAIEAELIYSSSAGGRKNSPIEQQQQQVSNPNLVGGPKRPKLKDIDLGSSSGSSSDSGVFGGNGGGSSVSSNQCSSISSLADSSSSSDDTASSSDVDMSDTSQHHHCCTCKSRYQNNLISEFKSHRTEQVPPAADDEFGQCALDWHEDSHVNYHKNKLIALISAGMTTGSDKKYVTDTVANLIQLGYEVVVFIRRGVGGLKLSSKKFFSPAKWRDFEAAIKSIKQQRPEASLVAVGFSFGSIELCRYLSMSSDQSLIDAALLVSCPFDPEAGGRNMRKRVLNRKIDAYLAKNLGKQLYTAMLGLDQEMPAQQQQQQLSIISNLNGSLVNLAKLPKIKSLVDFEDNYNRILQNYPTSEAYADDSRLREHLHKIRTPTLCLSSEDDFMAPIKLLPLTEIKSNPNLCMVLTKRGGHMAFIDGLLWPKKPYFAQRIIGSYMRAMRERLQNKQRTFQAGIPLVHHHKNHIARFR